MLPKNLSPVQRQQAFTARQQRIYAFLNEHHTGVLSSVTPDGNPHGVVVYYTIDHDFNIHIITKTGTHKYDNLTHNENVILTVYEPTTQTTAQFTGFAVEQAGIKNINETANAIFVRLAADNEGLPPITKLEAGTFTTFRLEPVQIRMAMYARPITGGYTELFESIESFHLKNS